VVFVSLIKHPCYNNQDAINQFNRLTTWESYIWTGYRPYSLCWESTKGLIWFFNWQH